MFYYPIEIIWDTTQECTYSDPCIQSQSEELRSFFDHKYLYRKYRKGNFVRKSINKYLLEKRGYPLEKKSGKRCFKKSENFEWQPQALLPGQYSFFSRWPPDLVFRVKNSSGGLRHNGYKWPNWSDQVSKKIGLKMFSFLRCYQISSSDQTGSHGR